MAKTKIAETTSAAPAVQPAETVSPTPVEQTAPPESAQAEQPAQTVPSTEIDLKALLEAGVHFGHQAQRWNPKMRQYIYAEKDGVHIFDLIKTAAQLEEAMKFARKLGQEGKTLVFVGTKRQAQDIVREKAEAAGAMYIVNRWLGGLLTNWDQVSKSIRRMNHIRTGLEKGEFAHYTKFERNELQKEADRLARFFAGVADLKQMPDALFIIDVIEEKVAIKEAKLTSIPMIAVVDSNGNPEDATYVIPGNDDAVSSLTLLVELIANAYAEGKQSKSKN